MVRAASYAALMHSMAIALLLTTAAGPSRAADGLSESEKSLIKSTCTVCHTEDRILNSDPEQLRATLDTMKEKNPALFADVDEASLNAALLKMLNDPAVTLRRQAWHELLADGRELFTDPSLGSTGKSCASCHDEESLRGVAGDYPRFDARLDRYVSLLDKVNWMIANKMVGKTLPLGDPKSVALEAYLKSLR